MRPRTTRLLLGLLTAATLAAVEANGAAAEPTAPERVSVTWEHRQATFNYYGITTAYNCDALAVQVRRILTYLGARDDLTVSAQGCPLDRPGHNAWVKADFNVPTPAVGDQAAAGVPGRWNRVKLTPRNPAFMDDGDCELMQELKDLVVKNFHFRRLDYVTSCFPHTLISDAFSVIGEAPQVIAAK
jgi:hypothetical protein